MDRKALLEAILYVQGDCGIKPRVLKNILNVEIKQCHKILKDFADQYNSEKHGIILKNFNGTYKFVTSPEYGEVIGVLVGREKFKPLSKSAVETVGIIAYKQPVTRSEINKVRGINSDGVINTLLTKGLIKEKGFKKIPSKPVLYGITNHFYDYFQITSLNELPKFVRSSTNVQKEVNGQEAQKPHNETVF